MKPNSRRQETLVQFNFPRSWIQGRGHTTTPFDMTVLNDLDRYHFAGDVEIVCRDYGTPAHTSRSCCATNLVEHTRYIRQHGDDMPEVENWTWPY